jgi:hypothetical protein
MHTHCQQAAGVAEPSARSPQLLGRRHALSRARRFRGEERLSRTESGPLDASWPSGCWQPRQQGVGLRSSRDQAPRLARSKKKKLTTTSCVGEDSLHALCAPAPVLAEAAAAAVLATVAPPPACCSQRPLLPQSLQNLRSRPCSHLPSFAVFFAGAALFFALSSAAAAFAVAVAAAFAAAAASLSPPSLSPPAPPLTTPVSPPLVFERLTHLPVEIHASCFTGFTGFRQDFLQIFTTFPYRATAELASKRFRRFWVLRSERPLWWASLYSRALSLLSA